MSKFKEVVHNEERIYIHNDLASSVFHAKENVLRVKKTQEAGIHNILCQLLQCMLLRLKQKLVF
jgi:hypothetical protein